jgi:integrase-like protein
MGMPAVFANPYASSSQHIFPPESLNLGYRQLIIDDKMELKMKLLDQVRHVIRKKHYSIRIEQAYTNWIKKFILFNDKRHPKDMGEKEISQYISYLAVKRNVSASTQNQALNAVVFLYKQVLKRSGGLRACGGMGVKSPLDMVEQEKFREN